LYEWGEERRGGGGEQGKNPLRRGSSISLGGGRREEKLRDLAGEEGGRGDPTKLPLIFSLSASLFERTCPRTGRKRKKEGRSEGLCVMSISTFSARKRVVD